jgi:predicted MFS family arabinose efflux permease
MDRMALGIVLEDIKSDLRLSDTQLGLITGIAFALFYSLMGIPIARWADRGSRTTIIVLTTALWSVAVALCGGATTFLQLLLVRVGVAVGEAGAVPPAHSLISDYFSREDRPRALGIYTMGTSLSFFSGYFLAGWINQIWGWRTTFLLLGIPGLILAAVAWGTLKDPRSSSYTPPESQPSVRNTWAALSGNSTFRHLLLCLSVTLFFTYGVVQWQPAFFIRTYGLKTGELGGWLALAYGAFGLVGNYFGGVLATRFAGGNERLQLQATAIAFCIVGIFSSLVYLAPNHYWAIASLCVAIVGLSAVNGPILATIQTLVPGNMRATAIAIVLLFSNLIGMGLGPLATGALSDAMRPEFGEDSLRYALLILCPGFLWCAWHAWRASQTAIVDLALHRRQEALDGQATPSLSG